MKKNIIWIFLIFVGIFTGAILSFVILESRGKIEKIEVIPSSGEYLPRIGRDGKITQSKIKLLNLSMKITTPRELLEEDEKEDYPSITPSILDCIHPNESIIFLKGTVRNEYEKGFKRERYLVYLTAYGYDSSGVEIARTEMGGFGSPHKEGVLLSIKEGEEGVFQLVMRYSERIATIKIYAQLADWPAP